MAVYTMATEADPEFQAAVAARDAAFEGIPQSRAYLLPRVDFTGDVSRDRYDPRSNTTAQPGGGFHSYATNKTFTLELRQALYQRARFVQLEQADHDAAQAEAVYRVAEQDLALRVAESYFQALAAQDNLDFVTADKEAIVVALEQAKHRYEVGLAAMTDVYESQARYDFAVSEEFNAEKLLQDAYESLFALTGRKVRELDGLREIVALQTPDPPDPDRWVRMALDRSPLLIAATEAANSARLAVDMQKSGHYPSLDLTATYQYRDNDFGGFGTLPIERNDKALGLQLRVPIYQGGLVSSQARQAGYKYAEARQVQLNQQRDIELRARESYRGVVVELNKAKALQQAILSNEKALEASRTGYRVGTRNITDVLDAQRELLRAKRDHARARYDYLLNLLRLKQAVGVIEVADLESMNRLLQ